MSRVAVFLLTLFFLGQAAFAAKMQNCRTVLSRIAGEIESERAKKPNAVTVDLATCYVYEVEGGLEFEQLDAESAAKYLLRIASIMGDELKNDSKFSEIPRRDKYRPKYLQTWLRVYDRLSGKGIDLTKLAPHGGAYKKEILKDAQREEESSAQKITAPQGAQSEMKPSPPKKVMFIPGELRVAAHVLLTGIVENSPDDFIANWLDLRNRASNPADVFSIKIYQPKGQEASTLDLMNAMAPSWFRQLLKLMRQKKYAAWSEILKVLMAIDTSNLESLTLLESFHDYDSHDSDSKIVELVDSITALIMYRQLIAGFVKINEAAEEPQRRLKYLEGLLWNDTTQPEDERPSREKEKEEIRKLDEHLQSLFEVQAVNEKIQRRVVAELRNRISLRNLSLAGQLDDLLTQTATPQNLTKFRQIVIEHLTEVFSN